MKMSMSQTLRTLFCKDSATPKRFRPLLPEQEVAAEKAQKEMTVNEVDAIRTALWRVERGFSTADDAHLLRQAIFYRDR